MSQKPPCFILDISRLLMRAGHTAPTGIDRVELSYAEYLLNCYSHQIQFTALAFTSWMGALPVSKVRLFINALLDLWNLGHIETLSTVKTVARQLKSYLLLGRKITQYEGPSYYLLLSHHHLMKMGVIRHFLKQTGAKFVPMVHDLIPIDYPEYATPREPKRHKARIKTVTALADAVIVPTNAVRNSLIPHFQYAQRKNVPIWTIPHGVHEQAINRNFSYDDKEKQNRFHPYFVYLSTIEPRKNHLLLLQLWRKMVEERGKENVPRLILVGKRGWENENILDLLERSLSLKDTVIEKNRLSDEDVALLLRHSNGLLFPSFVEGYGLPLAEAMSSALPSICADIPVLREVGGTIPLYCDPLDAPAWLKGIDDFSVHGPIWQKQKKDLENWQPYPWKESIATALGHCCNL